MLSLDKNDIPIEEKRFLDELVKSVCEIIQDDKMINKCDECQGLIGRYLRRCDIEFYPCSTNKVITDNVTGHSFIVALIGKNYYLIDPSFKQFKYLENNEVIIRGFRCISQSPYYYLSILDKSLANELVNSGYFKLTETSAYAYGNAFYFTKTSIPADLKLIPIKGLIFIEAFKKGNDILSDYNTMEIGFDLQDTRKK